MVKVMAEIFWTTAIFFKAVSGKEISITIAAMVSLVEFDRQFIANSFF